MPSITCIDNLVNDATTTLCGYIPYYLDMYKNCIIDMHSDPRQDHSQKLLAIKSSVLLLRVSSKSQVEGLCERLNIPLMYKGQSILKKVPNCRKSLQSKRKTVHFHRILDYNPPEVELPQILFQFDYVVLLNISLHKEGNLFHILPSSFVDWLEEHTVYVQAVDRVFKVENLEPKAYSGKLKFIEDDLWEDNIQCSLSWPEDFEAIARKSALARNDSNNRSDMSRRCYADRHKPKSKASEEKTKHRGVCFVSRRIFKRNILVGLHRYPPRIFFDKDMRGMVSGENYSFLTNSSIDVFWKRFKQFNCFVHKIDPKHTLDNKTRIRNRLLRLAKLRKQNLKDTYTFAATDQSESDKSEQMDM